MNRYMIKWKGMIAVSRGKTAIEAFENYNNRPLFGAHGTRFCNAYVVKYDAKTRGVEWVKYKYQGKDNLQMFVMVEKIQTKTPAQRKRRTAC